MIADVPASSPGRPMTDPALPLGLADVEAARRRIEGRVRRTPLVRLGALSRRLGVAVLAKAENLQRGGAFKIRGATNALEAALERGSPVRGLVTYSSGNHGQAVALAAASRGLPAIVAMPEDAPSVKIDAVRRIGAEVRFAGRTSEDRRIVAEALAKERAFMLVRPFDDVDVVAGQGTVALEILGGCAEVETIVVPCGGGGLVAGVALTATETRRAIAVWSAESVEAPKMARSLEAGRIVSSPPGPSVADGLRPNAPGEIPFRIARSRLAGAARVEESSILDAMRGLLLEDRLVVEPSGAAAVAALAAGRVPVGRGPVVVILSGGNVDPALLARVIRGGERDEEPPREPSGRVLR